MELPRDMIGMLRHAVNARILKQAFARVSTTDLVVGGSVCGSPLWATSRT